MLSCASEREVIKGGGLRESRRPVSGFTLIEILVAISVFAVLVSVVLGSLKFLLSKTDLMKEGITIYEEARISLDRISTDLRAVYVSVAPGYKIPDIDDDPDPYRFFCEASGNDDTRLEFTAFSHLPLGGGIPATAGKIMYYLQETEDDGWVLMRSDQALKVDDDSERFPDRDDAGTDPVLCRNVKTFRIICFDQDGKEYESWDSDANDVSYATPAAVLVRMEIEGLHGVHTFETSVAMPVFRKKVADVKKKN
jgi:prepilin-type N-terminal cleavage/methylation domain-containing protein